MVLIAQPGTFPKEENIGENYESIVLVAGVEDSIPIEIAQKIFNSGCSVSISMLPKKANDMDLAFTIGALIGEYGGVHNVVISVSNSPTVEMLKKMGMADCLYAVTKKTSSRQVGSDAVASKTRTAKGTFTKAITAKREKAVPSATNKSPKTTIPAAFKKILIGCGVSSEYGEQIFNAVQESAEYLSYEVRLRFVISDKDVAAEIYSKTKDRYKELKALV